MTTTKSTKPTKAIAYLRVSTADQANEGVSLPAQLKRIKAWAVAQNLRLVKVFTEAGASGSSLDRPEFLKAMEWLDGRKTEKRSGALIVLKLDRLTRSVVDLNLLLDRYFKDGNLTLLSVEDNLDTRSANGRMMLNIMMTMSQWEREAIQERTQTALDYKRQRGERVGSIRYGYKLAADGKTEEECPKEQRIIQKVRELRDSGMPLRQISKRLAELNLVSRTGRPFGAEQIQRILGVRRKRARKKAGAGRKLLVEG